MTETPPDWVRDVSTPKRRELPAPQWDEVSQNALDDMRGRLRESILQAVLLAVRGFFLPGPIGAAFEQIAEWAGDLAKDIGNLGGGISQALEKLQRIIDGVLRKAGAGIGEFIEFMLGSLGFGGIHAAGSLFGTGQVGDVNPELLVNGSFDGIVSMPEGGGWQWDSAVDHTGRAGSGSARVTATGTLRSMNSNAVDVFETNRIDAGVWVKWSNRSGTGSAALVLNVFDEFDTVIDAPVLATAPPGADSDWVRLGGEYTVPKLIGGRVPSHVCLGFTVDANVVGGTFWWDDASLRKVNPITHKLVGGFQDAIEGFTGVADATLNDFVQGLKNFDLIDTGTIIDDFIPGLGLLLENGIRGLRSLPPATGVFTHEQFLQAALGQAESTTGNANSIQTILRYLNAGVYDEFERRGPSLGSNWSTPWGSGNGTLTTEGHNAALPFVWPGGNSQWFSRYVGPNAASVTDWQVVSIVLGSSPGLAPFNYCGHNDVLGRVGGTGDYIRLRIGGDGSWSLSKFVSGVEYIMAREFAGAITVPGPGSIITLYCGDRAANNLAHFRATINNATLVDIDEPIGGSFGPASNCGGLYRGRGLGLRAEGIPFIMAGWVSPGLVNYWSSSDQPEPVV